jgi:hypothetical protein
VEEEEEEEAAAGDMKEDAGGEDLGARGGGGGEEGGGGDKSSPEFPAHEAKTMAFLCALAYKTPEEVNAEVGPDLVCPLLNNAEDNSGFYIALSSTGALRVVFRGTCCLSNIVTDLEVNMCPVRYKYGLAPHEGEETGALNGDDGRCGPVRVCGDSSYRGKVKW